MFRDYDKAKSMLKGSFENILGLMDKRYVSYDEIKELMVEALYKLSKENEKVETKTVTMPQVLYGPPPMQEVHEVKMPQVLYGPPPMPEIHEVHVEEEVHEVKMPQVLYGPPPMWKEERVVVGPQVLYGPPSMSRGESRSEMVDMFDDDYIPGTNVRKPRAQKPGETEDEYLTYLENYYATYLPNNGNNKGPRK